MVYGMAHDTPDTTRASDRFLTTTQGLPSASRPAVVDLADGDSFDLEIAPVAKKIEGASVRMLAYNGSIPGPTLRVSEGSRLTVRATNTRTAHDGEREERRESRRCSGEREHRWEDDHDHGSP